MSEPKTYCDGIIIKTKRFDDGGEILKVSVKVDDLIAFLNKHNSNGWVNLDIVKRREAGGPKKDVTHSVVLNTFKPKDAPAQQQASAPTTSNNGLPF